jgi:hypothetical protein
VVEGVAVNVKPNKAEAVVVELMAQQEVVVLLLV